jgi:hypothetical protein
MRNTRAWLGPILFTVASCTCAPCGKKPSGPPAPDYAALLKALPRAAVSRPQALVPEELLGSAGSYPTLVLATSDARGTYDALLATDFGKALVQGGAIDHLKLSSQLESALSVGHELATASVYPLAADKLADALAGPAAFGIALNDKHSRFVAVKEVDPSQEQVVRLALMAASMKTEADAEVEPEDYNGVKISKLKRGAKPVWVAAFQNVVIVSNDFALTHAAADLATGKTSNSAEKSTAFKEESASLKGPQAALALHLEKGDVASTLTDVSDLVLRLELSPVVVKVRGTLNSDPGEVAGLRALAAVPQDAAFFTSLGAANPDQVMTRLGGGSATEELKIPEPMMAAVSNEAFYALMGVEKRQFNHLVGLGLKDSAAAAKALPEAAAAWMDNPQDRDFGSVKGFCASGGGLCVAVTKDFLLASNDQQTLTNAVETSLGKRPSLSDVKGFAQVAKAGDKRYLTTYLSAAHASDVALSFFEETAARSSQSFDAADVGETVGPLCKALRTLPPFGGGVDSTGTTVAGELRPLPAQ